MEQVQTFDQIDGQRDERSENLTAESPLSVRLAQIAAAVAARQSELAGGGQSDTSATSQACPIDPAERAACDSCQ